MLTVMDVKEIFEVIMLKKEFTREEYFGIAAKKIEGKKRLRDLLFLTLMS